VWEAQQQLDEPIAAVGTDEVFDLGEVQRKVATRNFVPDKTGFCAITTEPIG
jgi:hypothetical protein